MKNSNPIIHWCWPEIFSQHADVREALCAIGDVRSSESLPDAGNSVEILVPRMSHDVNFSRLEQWPALRIIATPSTGIDHIDVQEATRRNIRVLSLRFDNEFLNTLQGTAELTWLLVLACARRLRAASTNAMHDRWNAMAYRGHELAGKTLGIIGLGRLGTMVARFGIAFGMNIVAYDIRKVEVDGVRCVGLDELLEAADFVCVHVHLDETTRGLLGRREIFLMKPGAILVNTSRGAVLCESALLDALCTGHLFAAGLDVLNGERDDKFQSHPLIQYARDHDNLVLTPHMGGSTVESHSKAFLHITRKIDEAWHSLDQTTGT